MYARHWAFGAVGALAMLGAAQAEEAKPAATPAPLTPPAPATSAVEANASAPSGVMSQSKFLSALYSEIAKHTPEKSPAGAGEVTASFHVNAAGKVDKVTIDKASSPALGEAVKKILASVSAPPPPGGGMDVGQTFRFNKSEGDK